MSLPIPRTAAQISNMSEDAINIVLQSLGADASTIAYDTIDAKRWKLRGKLNLLVFGDGYFDYSTF